MRSPAPHAGGLAFLADGRIDGAVRRGLFGTVWGICAPGGRYRRYGIVGKVAGPVGEALIMTALGLAAAVPAVVGYNWLVRRNKGVMDEVRAFGNDLHAVLLVADSSKER